MWGPKAKDWLASSGQDFHGVLLTEAREAATSKAVRYMRKHGFVATGANVTGLGGTTGGVLVGLLSHLTFWFSPPPPGLPPIPEWWAGTGKLCLSESASRP